LKELLEKVKDEYNISEIYDRTYDIAKQSKLSQHNLDNKLASNLYELLENKNSAVMLNWNMNIVNSYTISVLERIKNLESFIVSPEINFAKIRELGKTRLKKALLVYSKLKGMTIDVDIAENKDEVITNKENDRFNIIRNEYGTEIFLDKPLNIINIEEDIKKLIHSSDVPEGKIINLKDKNIYSRVDVKREKGSSRGRVHISFELLDKFNDAAKHSSLIKNRVSDVLKEEGSNKTEAYYKKLQEKPFVSNVYLTVPGYLYYIGTYGFTTIFVLGTLFLITSIIKDVRKSRG